MIINDEKAMSIFLKKIVLGTVLLSVHYLAYSQKPNIILIMADDMGYSDIGAFGSEIATPNLDKLAAKGLTMSQVYNASRCCPSRASLLTGLYPHQAGIGDMVNPRPIPAYQGFLSKKAVTIAEVLKTGGYRTFMAGKWHVGTMQDYWPLQRGFDRYFGIIDGASSYFNPTAPYRPNQKLNLVLDNQRVQPSKDFYSTNAFTDFGIKLIEDSRSSKQPFFLYMAYTSPHWPLHALPEDIKKYIGKYKSIGWDKLREERLKKMVQLGILPKSTKLSARDLGLVDWQSLTEREKEDWDNKMATYAAMVDRMDQNIGRILAVLEKTGQRENTLIIFLSDNGASHEQIAGAGFLPEILAANKKEASDNSSFTAYGKMGANVSNTPFKSYKHWQFEGGISTPFILNFPSKLKNKTFSSKPAHIMDIMATCIEVAGIPYPTEFMGNKITPTTGKSLLPLLNNQKWQGHEAIFFEHEGAVRMGDWKLVSSYGQERWELYNMVKDRTEQNDVSNSNLAIVKKMEAMYVAWAKKSGVVPYDQLKK
jgi:arylsulfatase A-like enzyme